MDILDSIEVRWFIDDVASPAAAAAGAWFDGITAEGERTDRYLVTARSDLGFKARLEDGRRERFEAKYLFGSLGPTPLHDRFAGDIERWRKLSLEIADPALERSGTWVRVAKARRLRKYRYEDGAVSTIDDPGEQRPDAGCGVELTELEYEVGGRSGRAMTIGLEAFGPERVLLDVLLRASRLAFDSAAGLCLGAEQSASYPRWLQRLGPGPG